MSKNTSNMTTNEKIMVVRSLRKQQFCKIEMRPNRNYKPEEKDTRQAVFDIKRSDVLRKSLSCKGKMVDGTEICKFPERFLRSVSDKPPKKPPSTNAYKVRGIKNLKTEFKRQYDRGDLPLYIALSKTKRRIAWKVHYGDVNFVKFLPIFFEGIQEKRDPLNFLAKNGTLELLEYIDLPTLIESLPEVMRNIYASFDSNDKEIICDTIKCVQKLVLTHPGVGPELVPYYRYLLPGMRLFVSRNKNLGDKFEYGQHKRTNIGDLIDETLHILELHGGSASLYHIKRFVPQYTSKKQILTTLPAEELARRQGKQYSLSRRATGSGGGTRTLYDGRRTR